MNKTESSSSQTDVFLLDFGWHYGSSINKSTSTEHIHRAYSLKQSIQLFIDRDRQEIKRGRERERDKKIYILCRVAVGKGFDPTQAVDCVSAEGCGHDLSTNLRHGFNFFNQPSSTTWIDQKLKMYLFQHPQHSRRSHFASKR